jgi:hypothetical protein
LILEVATNALDVDCNIVREDVDEAGDVVGAQDSGGGVVGKTRCLVMTNFPDFSASTLGCDKRTST